MSEYEGVFEDLFLMNLGRHSSIRKSIKRRVDRILAHPYLNTELLGAVSGRLNLRGSRSARVDRNFRIVFVVCEECRKVPECEYCFCEDLPDQTVIFLTVGPHDKAYAMK